MQMDAGPAPIWVAHNVDCRVDFARSPIFFSIAIKHFPDRSDIGQSNEIFRDTIGGKIMHAEKIQIAPLAQIAED